MPAMEPAGSAPAVRQKMVFDMKTCTFLPEDGDRYLTNSGLTEKEFNYRVDVRMRGQRRTMVENQIKFESFDQLETNFKLTRRKEKRTIINIVKSNSSSKAYMEKNIESVTNKGEQMQATLEKTLSEEGKRKLAEKGQAAEEEAAAATDAAEEAVKETDDAPSAGPRAGFHTVRLKVRRSLAVATSEKVLADLGIAERRAGTHDKAVAPSQADREKQQMVANIRKTAASTGERNRNYRAIFDKYDTDRSGSIEIHELGHIMQQLGHIKLQPSEEELAVFMQEIDTNGDGEIDFGEFLSAMESRVMQTVNTHRLVKAKNPESFIYALIDTVGSADVVDERGWTCLHHCAEHNYLRHTAALLSIGADTTLRTTATYGMFCAGCTPLDVAMAIEAQLGCQRSEFISMLKSAPLLSRHEAVTTIARFARGMLQRNSAENIHKATVALRSSVQFSAAGHRQRVPVKSSSAAVSLDAMLTSEPKTTVSPRRTPISSWVMDGVMGSPTKQASPANTSPRPTAPLHTANDWEDMTEQLGTSKERDHSGDLDSNRMKSFDSSALHRAQNVAGGRAEPDMEEAAVIQKMIIKNGEMKEVVDKDRPEKSRGVAKQSPARSAGNASIASRRRGARRGDSSDSEGDAKPRQRRARRVRPVRGSDDDSDGSNQSSRLGRNRSGRSVRSEVSSTASNAKGQASKAKQRADSDSDDSPTKSGSKPKVARNAVGRMNRSTEASLMGFGGGGGGGHAKNEEPPPKPKTTPAKIKSMPASGKKSIWDSDSD